MTKKLIDINEKDLAEAGRILDADTMKDTVNQALAEVIRSAQRRTHAQRLTTMDGLDLHDETVMADAWR
jgi:Arc/MetJ family transcription regulator